MSNLSLYNITDRFVEIMDKVQEGEITEEQYNELGQELAIALQNKSIGIIGYIQNKEALIDAVDTQIKRLQELKKAESNSIDKFKQYVKENMEKLGIQKLETEIKLINDNIDKMYVDKLNNKISEEMYSRLFSKLRKEVKQKEQEYSELVAIKERNKEDDTEDIKKAVKEFLKLEEPTPEFMKVIINRIELHQDKQVDIVFNFKKLNNITNQNCLL